MLADFYDLKTSNFMFKSCCDGHFLQRACCPSAVWVLGVVLYDKPAQKSTKKQAHTLHSSSSWILFWFQSNTLILNRDPRTPLSFLYTRHWRLFPSNVSWDVLSPWAVPSCKHKSPGKERCDGETNEKENSASTNLQDRVRIHHSRLRVLSIIEFITTMVHYHCE